MACLRFRHALIAILLIARSLSAPPTPPHVLPSDMICFDDKLSTAFPVSVRLCELASEFILRRDGPAEFFRPQRFIRGEPQQPDEHVVPDEWQLEDGAESCQIRLTSFAPGVVDTFTLNDVRGVADRIIRTCPSSSKESLGGLLYLGILGFYVSVNGKDPNDFGRGSENLTAPMQEGIARLPWGEMQTD